MCKLCIMLCIIELTDDELFAHGARGILWRQVNRLSSSLIISFASTVSMCRCDAARAQKISSLQRAGH